MANSKKTFTLKLPNNIYDRLTRIKKKYNLTYSEVIGKLVELELQNNYIIQVHDYQFITESSDGVFRVLQKKEEVIFEYLTEKGYTNHIKDWKVDDKTKRVFRQFIKDYGAELLFKIEVSMEFQEFIIFRI